jgi:hypothetical protein
VPKNPSEDPNLENYQLAKYVKDDDKQCKALIGYTWEEFQALAVEFQPAIDSYTVDATPRQSAAPPRTKYTAEFCLFVTLLFCYSYPCAAVLATLFCVHPRTLTRLIARTLRSCGPILKAEVKWPTDEEFQAYLEELRAMVPPECPGAITVIDGTEWTKKVGLSVLPLIVIDLGHTISIAIFILIWKHLHLTCCNRCL